jgi:AraC-like DNA-binding protein
MKETATFWHAPDIGDLELLKATYISHAFSRHTHPGYVVGMIERGVEVFYYRGETHAALPGDVVVINPGEVHTGHSGDERGWTYRMFYPAVQTLTIVAEAMADHPVDIPYFPRAVIKDRRLALKIKQLHMLLEQSTSPLERQERYYEVMGDLIRTQARNSPALKKQGRERHTIKQALQMINDTIPENISLETLSHQVGLSPFYFTRLFRQYTGLPPHAYRKQQRILLAKQLLRKRIPISQVAAEAGFADQSHLTRHFKQVIGITPGQYTQSLQEPEDSRSCVAKGSQ